MIKIEAPIILGIRGPPNSAPMLFIFRLTIRTAIAIIAKIEKTVTENARLPGGTWNCFCSGVVPATAQ